jgi:hypothetical protein
MTADAMPSDEARGLFDALRAIEEHGRAAALRELRPEFAAVLNDPVFSDEVRLNAFFLLVEANQSPLTRNQG